MELVNVLRKAGRLGPGAGDPAVREGRGGGDHVVAGRAVHRRGHVGGVGPRTEVARAGWPAVDPDLVAADTVTCVVADRRQGP